MHWSGRQRLGWLHNEIGIAGLAAAAATPGLAAMVDQHAAAVRDSISLGLEGSVAAAGLVLLASYGCGVLEHARERGWQPLAAGDARWPEADWTSLRLVAVCALAETADDPLPQLPPLDEPPQHAS